MSKRFSLAVLSALVRAAGAVIKALTASMAGERRSVYNPARHYMRGPGPKWLARHGAAPGSEPQPHTRHDG